MLPLTHRRPPGQSLHRFDDEGSEDDHQGEPEQQEGYGPPEEDGEVSPAYRRGLHQRLFHDAADDETQDNRRSGVIVALHEVSDHAEGQGQPHAPQSVLDCEGTEEAEEQDERIHHFVAHSQHGSEEGCQRQIHDQQDDVTYVERSQQTPHHVRLLLYEERPRLYAEEQERSQQDGGGGRARYSQRQERHERRVGGGVVRRFRGGQPFDGSFPEIRFARGDSALEVVGEEGGQ